MERHVGDQHATVRPSAAEVAPAPSQLVGDPVPEVVAPVRSDVSPVLGEQRGRQWPEDFPDAVTPSSAPARIRRLDRRPQRVMFFGKSMSRSRCTGALVDALRGNGMEVRWRNMATLRRWIGERAAAGVVRREFDRWQPDLVFIFWMDLPSELVEAFEGRATIVQWVEEAFPELPPCHARYMRHADLVCASNPALFPQLRSHGIDRTSFQMSGFSTRFHYPSWRTKKVRDIAFIGGPGLDGMRAKFLLELADRHDIAVFGRGWEGYQGAHPRLRVHAPISNRGYRKVCAQSRILLGMNQFNSYPQYFSNRVWLTLACRGFHLTHWVPGIDGVFERGEHLDWFEDVDEAVERIEHYLARPEERQRIAENGWRYAVENHQYRHRIAEILRILDGSVTPDISPLRSWHGASVSPGFARGQASSE